MNWPWLFQENEAPISPLLRFGLVFVIMLAAIFFESRRPLREPTQPKHKRVLINLSVAMVAAITLKFTFYPIVMLVAYKSSAHRTGLLPALGITGPLGAAVSLLLLDWTLYYWHWLLHKIPFFWRFHNAHHIDLDLDSSTALRFHFGELAISTAFRSFQIVVFGISPFSLALFELLITSFAQFHHSNIRLPLNFEKGLCKILITPRLHGIHHSIVRSETDANFGTIFTWWDRIHRTFNNGVPQSQITIGVPSYRDSSEQSLWRILSVPFRGQREWKLPDGSVPARNTGSTRIKNELAP